jgi:hypothetical protein
MAKESGVHFEPLLLQEYKPDDNQRRQDAPTFKANTSFLPAIKPKVVKMTPFVRKRAVESEMSFLKELYRTAGGDKWYRNKYWGTDAESFAGWDNITGVDVGKKGDAHYQRRYPNAQMLPPLLYFVLEKIPKNT